MKLLKILIMLVFAVTICSQAIFTRSVQSQSSGAAFSSEDQLAPEPPTPAPDAPTGFDNITNGFENQADHLADQAAFEKRDEILADGLGPVYNAQSCSECHQQPVTGAISQITELRAGTNDANGFFLPANVLINDGLNGLTPGKDLILNRSLINDRAICPNVHVKSVDSQGNPIIDFNQPNQNLQERVDNLVQTNGRPLPDGTPVVSTFRTSLNLLGDGFVECIADTTLQGIASGQCNNPNPPGGVPICGQTIAVDVLEANQNLPPGAPTHKRLGRFGWKDQIPSLLSFSSDAYLNEIGITNRLKPNDTEFTVLCDEVKDPEDSPDLPPGKQDIDAFTRFMRATRAPSRDRNLVPDDSTDRGSQLFDQIGCAICHVRNITTAPVGTVINGGTFTVPASLGHMRIHPFGDFLLHQVGSGAGGMGGDGIVQTDGHQETRFLLRTPPLWGVRTRDRLMHNGEALTFTEAIELHDGTFSEAHGVVMLFNGLSATDKKALIKFLKSL